MHIFNPLAVLTSSCKMKHYKHVQSYNQSKLKENIARAAMNFVPKLKALYYIFQSLSNQ